MSDAHSVQEPAYIDLGLVFINSVANITIHAVTPDPQLKIKGLLLKL